MRSYSILPVVRIVALGAALMGLAGCSSSDGSYLVTAELNPGLSVSTNAFAFSLPEA